MIAIAANQARELAQRLLVRRHDSRFVDHQHAQPVADLQQFGGGRVVRGPIRVAAQLLQSLDAPLEQSVRHGGAHAGVVLMIARALELDRSAVEQEPALCIELDAAHAEGRVGGIDDAIVLFDAGFEPIQLRSLQRPERGSDKRVPLLDRSACSRLQRRHLADHIADRRCPAD